MSTKMISKTHHQLNQTTHTTPIIATVRAEIATPPTMLKKTIYTKRLQPANTTGALTRLGLRKPGQTCKLTCKSDENHPPTEISRWPRSVNNSGPLSSGKEEHNKKKPSKTKNSKKKTNRRDDNNFGSDRNDSDCTFSSTSTEIRHKKKNHLT